VWDGGSAHQLGLVDGFGGMEEAVAKAAEMAKLGDERGVQYLEPSRSFRDEVIDLFAFEDPEDEIPSTDAFTMLARRPQQQFAEAIGEVHSILSGPSIQARCLECPSVAPAAIRANDLSIIELVRKWLS
jgi:protease-4